MASYKQGSQFVRPVREFARASPATCQGSLVWQRVCQDFTTQQQGGGRVQAKGQREEESNQKRSHSTQAVLKNEQCRCTFLQLQLQGVQRGKVGAG